MDFVLVHGAWHGAWCWDRLTPLLTAAGATVSAPDLPGHGDDDRDPATVRLLDYVDAVVTCLDAFDRPVQLVGHSMGGVVISAVAERIPERVAHLVYVCAFLPRDGEVLSALGAEDRGSDLNPAIRPGPPGTLTVDPVAVRDVFYGDCENDDAREALARLTPQPIAPLQSPVHLTPERFGTCPRAYVLCTEDRAVTPTMQRTLIERSPCDPVVELATGHSPFLAAPAACAAALLGIAGVSS